MWRASNRGAGPYLRGKKNLRSGDGPNGGKYGGRCNNGLLSGSK